LRARGVFSSSDMENKKVKTSKPPVVTTSAPLLFLARPLSLVAFHTGNLNFLLPRRWCGGERERECVREREGDQDDDLFSLSATLDALLLQLLIHGAREPRTRLAHSILGRPSSHTGNRIFFLVHLGAVPVPKGSPEERDRALVSTPLGTERSGLFAAPAAAASFSPSLSHSSLSPSPS